MTYFIKNGNTFRISDEASIQVTKELPAGNYIVKFDNMAGAFYFEGVDGFSFGGKRYGDLDRNVERILGTFQSRPNSTGVMLTGEKGSGKSLLARTISLVGAERGIPTLVINSPWCGDTFNKFIQDIHQECIVLFDEFEKVYDSGDQQKLLTLLDGVFPSKKLFVFTCNDKYRVDTHMRNRPGRIFYMLDFAGLSQEFIREYCDDNLVAKEHADAICRVSSLLPMFTFDQLKALVEEMNRYSEGPEDALRMLNIKPEFNEPEMFNVRVTKPNGVEVPSDDLNDSTWGGNPLEMRSFRVGYYDDEQKSDEGNPKFVGFYTSTSDIASVNPDEGEFTFQSECGHKVILARHKTERPSYYSLLA